MAHTTLGVSSVKTELSKYGSGAGCWSAFAERRFSMGKTWLLLMSSALSMLLMVAPASGQWSSGPAGPPGGDTSTLVQSPSGSFEGDQPQAYHAYWHNYLDNLQREGGYYSVTGNYGGSVPVTSYYPSSESSSATSPEAAARQAAMYDTSTGQYATGVTGTARGCCALPVRKKTATRTGR